MASPRRNRRSGFPAQAIVLLVGALLLAGVGSTLLWRSLNGPGNGADAQNTEGMIGVPVATTDLPSYTEIRLEHLLKAQTGELAAVYLPEESILDTTIVDPRDLLGRVLARPKTARRVFSESDLMPIGTRPGIVAGIPDGQRALRIDASKVSGIVGLRQGDRFDLVATYPGANRAGAAESVYGNTPNSRGQRARARVVASGATVVSALENRALPGAAGGRSGKIVQEIVIALGPDEIPSVTEALEIAKRIDCIPRSGLPTSPAEEEASIAEAPAPRAPRDFYDEPLVDVIEGDRRSLRFIPENAVPAVSAGPLNRGS
ncbi:MAG: hypothetical protein AB8G23_05540 [Myxococcota bacterium]